MPIFCLVNYVSPFMKNIVQLYCELTYKGCVNYDK